MNAARRLIVLLLAAAWVQGAEFAVYDVYLDPEGDALAAYQLKIWDKRGAVKILSVEGGEHEAFRQAPFFDTKAIQRDVIKLAAFRAEKSENLPAGRTRVASLHVEIGPGMTPNLAVELTAAARPGGIKTFPKVTVIKRETE